MYLILFLTLVSWSSQTTPGRDLIQKINQQNTTWTAGENFPENVTVADMRRLTGALKPSPNSTLQVATFNIPKNQIPESFDAREAWPKCADIIGGIRDQGSCGSCWAFSATEVMSDRLCIGSGGQSKFNFSVQDLLECCPKCLADTDGCKGGYPDHAFEHWLKNGIVSGGDHVSKTGCKSYSVSAYTSGIGPLSCYKSCQSNYQTSYEDDKKFADYAYIKEEPTVEEIQAEIMTNGSVSAVYRVYEDFYNYKNGVYQHVLGDFEGNHAIKIIGWGVEVIDNQKVPYWLVANSWGTGWGDLGGFFKILRGANHCGIEDFILGGTSSSTVLLPAPVFVMTIISIFLGIWS